MERNTDLYGEDELWYDAVIISITSLEFDIGAAVNFVSVIRKFFLQFLQLPELFWAWGYSQIPHFAGLGSDQLSWG